MMRTKTKPKELNYGWDVFSNTLIGAIDIQNQRRSVRVDDFRTGKNLSVKISNLLAKPDAILIATTHPVANYLVCIQLLIK